MANGGEGVSAGGGHFLLGGAEPLTNQQLSVGRPNLVRLSLISQRLLKEEPIGGQSDQQEIDIAADYLR